MPYLESLANRLLEPTAQIPTRAISIEKTCQSLLRLPSRQNSIAEIKGMTFRIKETGLYTQYPVDPMESEHGRRFKVIPCTDEVICINCRQNLLSAGNALKLGGTSQLPNE